MTDIKINVDAESINNQITEAVARSAIGVELEKAIEQTIREMRYARGTPYAKAVNDELYRVINGLVKDKYLPIIEAGVKENLTPEKVRQIFSKLWDKFVRDLS